jgi:hypothetical protein
MGTRRDEKKNSRGSYVFSLEAQAARDEARALVEEARKIRDEILGPRTAPVEAKVEEAAVSAPVEAPAAEPAPVETPKEVAPPSA